MSTAVSTTSLCDLSAAQMRVGYLSGDFTPSEVMASTLARIRDVNGDRATGINAFTEVLDDEATSQAASATERLHAARRRGDQLPLLFGIPVATKEKHALAGRTLEQGLAAHRGRIADADHPIVARIRAAGGIIHARTTSPEFSCATVTHSPMWGVTRNPYNLATSPGGSSGGAGAALAAGMAALATASDIAGSTRIPAGFTGTVGYKAPYGRIPGAPPLSADTYRGDGPMARTVDDTALLADVMSGHHHSDHFSWGGSGQLAGTLDAHTSLDGVRVGISITLGDFDVHPDVASATLRAAEALRQRGAEVVDVTLPWRSDEIRETIFAHFGHLLAPAMRAETAGGPTVAAYTEQFMRDAEAAAQRLSHLDSVAADARLQAQLASAMADVDALLCPVSAVTSLAADGNYLDGIEVVGPDATPVHLQHYWQAHLTSPFNVANRCPVLAVPAGIATDGVPIGVQLVGKPLDEVTPFRLGRAVEDALGVPSWREAQVRDSAPSETEARRVDAQ